MNIRSKSKLNKNTQNGSIRDSFAFRWKTYPPRSQQYGFGRVALDVLLGGLGDEVPDGVPQRVGGGGPLAEVEGAGPVRGARREAVAHRRRAAVHRHTLQYGDWGSYSSLEEEAYY